MANIMEKGADPDYKHFLRFPHHFHMARHSGISGKCCKVHYSPGIFIFRLLNTREWALSKGMPSIPRFAISYPVQMSDIRMK